MARPCFVDGCDTVPRAKKGRFCDRHQYELRMGRAREVNLLPKCPGCGTAMREPAPRCGLCDAEAIENAAKGTAA